MLRFLGLDACGLGSLDGIENLPHLNYLTFRYCHVYDLSPLSSATTLESLAITDNPVSDFSVLGDIKTLTFLWCSQAQSESVFEALGEPNNVYVQVE